MVTGTTDTALSNLENELLETKSELEEIKNSQKSSSSTQFPQVKQEKPFTDTVFFKILIFTIVIYLLFIYGFEWFTSIMDLIYIGMNFLFKSSFGDVFTGFASIAITIFLILNVFIWMIPFTKSTKEKFSTKSFTLLFIILFLVAIGSFWVNNTYTVSEEFKENINKSSNSFFAFISRVACLTDPTCAQKIATSTEAATIASKYTIRLEAQPSWSQTLEEWKKDKLELQYMIASSGTLKIRQLKIYQTTKDDDHLIYNSGELNLNISNDGNEEPVMLKYNFDNLKSEGEQDKDGKEKITIIPELLLEVDTQYIMYLPIISQDMYYNLNGMDATSDGPLKYHHPDTVTFMKTRDSEFQFKQSNDAFLLTSSYIKSMTPFIFGNGIAAEFPLTIEIQQNPSNSFGTLVSTELIEKPELSNFFSYQDGKEFEDFKDFNKALGSGEKFIQKLYLVENEGETDKIDLPIIKTQLDFKFRSVFSKEDGSTRFTIQLEGLETTDATTDSNTASSATNDNTVPNIELYSAQKTIFNDLNSDVSVLENSPSTQQSDLVNTKNIISQIEIIIKDIDSMGSTSNLNQENIIIYNSKVTEIKIKNTELEAVVKILKAQDNT